MDTNPARPLPRRTSRFAIGAAAILVVALLGVSAYFLARVNHLETQISSMQETLDSRTQQMLRLVEGARALEKERIAELERQLEEAQLLSSKAAGQVRLEAVRRAEELTRRLEQEQRRYQEQLAATAEEVKAAAEDARATVKEGLTQVEANVASTKTEVDTATAQLKRMQGDMGFMSGMIATNAKELAALRKLGDREYAEFDLSKSRQWTRVGNVSLKLKKTDTKRHKYSIELLADDRVVEKKDRYVNEPVQFYLSRAKHPYELVVNEVGKDKIVGYLAIPKGETGRPQVADAQQLR